jgi:hypothetical protein
LSSRALDIHTIKKNRTSLISGFFSETIVEKLQLFINSLQELKDLKVLLNQNEEKKTIAFETRKPSNQSKQNSLLKCPIFSSL